MNFERFNALNLSGKSRSRQLLRERATMLQQQSPMCRGNRTQQHSQVFSKPNQYVSTFSEIACRQRDIYDPNLTNISRKNHRRDFSVHSSQQQTSAYRNIRKRKLSDKNTSEIPFTISDDSDDDVDNKSCYHASQYSFQKQNHRHSRRHHLSHSNCCYTDNEKQRKVLLKSITSINDADARSRSSICDNTLDDSRDHRRISRSSSRSRFIRRCSSVISFRQLLAGADMADKDNETISTKNSPDDTKNNKVDNNENESSKNSVENSGKQRTGEILAKLDMMRKNLAGYCLPKFGRHCIPLMKTLNKDNMYDNVLEACIGPAKNNNMKQPSFMKRLFLSKQLTNVTDGFYISCTLQSAGRVLVTSQGLLPTVRVDLENMANLESHFYWLMKVTSDWSMMRNLKEVMKKEISNCKKMDRNIFHDKYAILRAVNILQKVTGIEKLGQLHTSIISGSNYNVFMFINDNVNDESSLTSSPAPSSLSTLTWMSTGKLSPSTVSNKKQKTSGVLNDLTSRCQELLIGSKNLNEQLKDGVYISFLYMTCHVQHGLQVLVSKETPSNFPSIRICEEHNGSSSTMGNCTNILKGLKDENFENIDDNFRSKMFSTMRQFDDVTFSQLPITPKSSPTSSPSSFAGVAVTNRLHTSIIPLNDQVKMVLLTPPQSLFCPLISHTPVPPLPSTFFLPLRTFEVVQMRSYQPQIYRKYCQVSVIMEMAVEMQRNRMAAQDTGNKHSQGEDTSELVSLNSRLTDLKKNMEETMKKYSWIADLIRDARQPVSKNFISRQQFS
ncbi:hypothetical protein HELRODRAFT_178297 [Helobdella robusta]|uniref:Uncharacterized protein n=1 Tax=Helobdella robusta TaxID=6412 RepID=T1FD21_HELRO|nr:hypothetical protein HELRODRAFT_178297 [Helobdella robusta]ESN97185.1 hypothetical protein HELRODRAFT_178297 [Helobdella robusta]